MRTIIAVLVLYTCAQSAIAKGPDCRAIESTTARLACNYAAYPLKLGNAQSLKPTLGGLRTRTHLQQKKLEPPPN